MGKRIEKFEDLDTWQKAMRLTADIHELLRECRQYSLRDQIQRAAVSVPSNIAEGFERQTSKEYIQYLFISKGSAGELRTQVYLVIELEMLDKNTGKELIDRCRKASSMLYNPIQTRRRTF